MGCFSKLDLTTETLDTALVNQPYDYHFSVDPGWDDWWDDSFVVRVYEGSLPAGMGVTADGELVGTPLELGDFDFRILVYDQDLFFENESWSDDEWFTLYVTEASTNSDCPSPDNEEVTEVALCLGSIETGELSAGDSVTLDVNFFVNADEAEHYDIRTLSFSVAYDPSLFAIDPASLNSTILREAATRSKATATYDTTVEGLLGVTLTEADKPFWRAGRLFDLPFTAAADLPAAGYPFTLTIVEISGDRDPSALLAIDGSLTITE